MGCGEWNSGEARGDKVISSSKLRAMLFERLCIELFTLMWYNGLNIIVEKNYGTEENENKGGDELDG